ncbi:aspartic peptidase A1 [Pholiota conissans]|uniref:Aspartic peptidase A1 n=1 Tax=Pholiota conissans TaxID=109636 RepID=A0A9P5ZAA5_9AGAR|nr:aspartic peptidase A1 [Pholiota conissans]
MRSLIPLSLLLTIFDYPVYGLIFPFDVRFAGDATTSLTRRSSAPLRNIGNAQYVGNISVAGTTLPVLLDTGSSDLWVNFPGTVPTSNMKDTGASVTLSYAVGKAAGDVYTAPVSIGNITMQDQAFLYVNDTSTFTSDIHAQGYDGLLGLGPNQSSVILKKLKKDASANTLLQRIFQADTSSSNYITLLLNRKNDPGQNMTGQFTVSEVVPGFENITSMPKLDVETVNKLLKSDQHWQALTDKNIGIIGPDGNPIDISSIVPSAPDGQLVAVVDSGYTFSQVPRDVSDAIYGRVQGAVYDSKNEYWLVPCGQYLNVSFNLGGKNYPIHPLDLVDNNFGIVDSSGKQVCIGAFQPITSAFSLLGHYDMILGMSFLRNAYMLLDFGDWIGESNDQDHPYIQLASIVNSAAARQDFVQVRLGGTDTISDPKWALLPADQMQHSPVSEEEKKKKYQEMVLSRWPYIFVGCLVFVLLVIGLLIWKCCCKRKQKNAKKTLEMEAGGLGGYDNKKKGGFFSKLQGKRESYVPLETPNRSMADLNNNNNQSTADFTSPSYPSQPRMSSASQGVPSPHGSHSAHYSQNYDQNASTNSLQAYPDQYPSYYPQQQQQQGGYGYSDAHGYQGQR